MPQKSYYYYVCLQWRSIMFYAKLFVQGFYYLANEIVFVPQSIWLSVYLF